MQRTSPVPRSLWQRRRVSRVRRGRRNARHQGTARRASSGPNYSAFGKLQADVYIDDKGREYVVANLSRHGQAATPSQPGHQVLFSRIPIRRRSQAARRKGTPIGGANTSAGAVASRSGGNWMPRWPMLGQDLTLFRIRDQVLARGTVYSVLTLPRSATARIELKADLYVSAAENDGEPMADPSIFLRWIVGAAAGGGGGRVRSGNETATVALTEGLPRSTGLESI